MSNLNSISNRLVFKFPQQYYQDLFDVDFDAGILYWKNCGKPSRNGSAAASPSTQRERYLKVWIGAIAGHMHVHQIIYYMANGPWHGTIDHIDGNPKNNALSNLRVIPAHRQQKNRGRSHNSIYPGVTFRQHHSSTPWRVRIATDYGRLHVGHFETLLDAVAAKKYFERHLGYHENHGARPGTPH